jgi:hypothetical protein
MAVTVVERRDGSTSENFSSRDCLESPNGHQTGAALANIEGREERIFALQASDLASLTPLQPSFQTVSLERLSGKSYARANRLTMRRIIAA